MGLEELNFVIGGEQGAGLETTAQILAYAFTKEGFNSIADREYYSNIKGKHSYVHSRISTETAPRSLTYPIQLLGCMDAETLFTHFDDLEEGGYVVYDTSTLDKNIEDIPSVDPPLKSRYKETKIGLEINELVEYLEEERDIEMIGLDFQELLKELADQFELSSPQASRYISTILVGAVSGLIDLNKKSLGESVKRRFEEKPKIAEQNKFFVELVYDKIKNKYDTPLKLKKGNHDEGKQLLVNGNEAVGMGKITGNITFQSYYPITPAADESLFLEEYGVSKNIVVIQTEDELAAVTSAIGSSLTGSRSATATSGPGYSLMVEGLGWAGMNEVPIVVTYYQRGGPSTGMPTRGGQSDLFSAIYGSHGQFPKIVLCSGDHEEAFYDAVEAFNLAEEYQVPVIHLLDKFLANSVVNMKLPEVSNIEIRRGHLGGNGEYKRFEDGPISKRAFLGKEVMWYTGSEHDEYGNVSEDPETRVQMQDKRMEKLEIADEEIPDEYRCQYFGSENPDFILVGWGSVKGVCLDAIDKLKDEFSGGYLHLRMFSPFPSKKVKEILGKGERCIAVEHTYSSLLRKAVSLNTNIDIENEIVKYTGRPMYLMEVKKAIRDILDGEKRKVVTHGP
ncbi:MAG: 2-oxoacid:ferredoxin oxidoreductase subunit alpha [Candidatus Saliniplasma sp.]